ncbi:SRPBCC domain-containing protein [Conexibacter sp. W3-3-2]|uniref:SRPBCC domain-containing protein n=1 Tax=Conexibacter sp. W3-3-2 TaxID=2675227 RepID=UPI0012B80139|nr:SRPBCC domain-containing protein [Conexibacter sp. W3-3-2]
MTSIGRTRDAGWQCGVRRTVAGVDPTGAWARLASAEGTAIWLGGPVALEPGPYALADGREGEIRVVRPGSHVRLTWQAAPGDPDTTLQLRVLPARTGTTVAVHQERLADAEQRAQMLAHWEGVLDALRPVLAGGA